jgi:hypothetical protein
MKSSAKKSISQWIVGGLIVVFVSTNVFAVNLDTPAKKKITVKSEIQRGSSAASNCIL